MLKILATEDQLLKIYKIHKYQNQPLGTSEIVHITDIIIPEEFAKTKCSYNKIRWAKEYYKRNGRFDKPITVIAETNERGNYNMLLLVDGYSRYLAALSLGLNYVSIEYIDIDTYCNERNM
jgi:hypothetical protein